MTDITYKALCERYQGGGDLELASDALAEGGTELAMEMVKEGHPCDALMYASERWIEEQKQEKFPDLLGMIKIYCFIDAVRDNCDDWMEDENESE